MAFLDIERIINQKNVDSRFKLVHLAALRARELNNPDETTVLADLKSSEKVTSKALTDIVRNKVQKKQKKKNLLKIINHNFIFIPCHTL